MQESFLEQKVFLNKEMKPYDELTREEKHMVLDAVFDNNCEAYDIGMEKWDDKTNSEFFNTSIYRTKPKEPERVFPTTSLTDDELVTAYCQEHISTEQYRNIANEAIKRYILEQEETV